MTTPTPFPTTTAARFTSLYATVTDRFGEIENAIATAHPATGCLPLPDFTTLRPASYSDLRRMASTVKSNLHGTNRGVAEEWLTAYDACTHLPRETVMDIFSLVQTWSQLLGALLSECASPRTWHGDVDKSNEIAIRRILAFTLDHIAADDDAKNAATTKSTADLSAAEYCPVPMVLLNASSNVLAMDIYRDYPETVSVDTVTAACAAQAALCRGWEPDSADAHGFDRERAEYNVEVITELDGGSKRMERIIALGASAVQWLNANGHISGDGNAVLDETGFHIEYPPLTVQDSVLTSFYAAGQPELDAITMVNASVAELGVMRGWVPPADAPEIAFQTGGQVADYIERLDEEGSEHGDEPIAHVAKAVVPWLIYSGHIAPGHLAFLDDDGFHIVPEVATETLDALKASTYDTESGWLDKQLVTITDHVTGVRDPHEDRPGHEAYQLLFDKDEQTGGGISYTEEAGYQTWGPVAAATGEIPSGRYPMNHPDFAAAVAWMTMTLTREWTKPMDMYDIHNRLLNLANGRGKGLDRLHAYMADIDGPYDDLPVEVLAVVEPIKAEIRARRSPTTLTVPTDAVPDADDAADGRPALEAWVTKAEQEGFQVQGFGSYFPGCESEDSGVTCGGVAIGYRWYAIDVVNGTAVARDVELEALEADIALWDQPQP